MNSQREGCYAGAQPIASTLWHTASESLEPIAVVGTSPQLVGFHGRFSTTDSVDPSGQMPVRLPSPDASVDVVVIELDSLVTSPPGATGQVLNHLAKSLRASSPTMRVDVAEYLRSSLTLSDWVNGTTPEQWLSRSGEVLALRDQTTWS